MRAELEERVAHALELARASGADDAWASASRSRGVEVHVRDGAIEKVRESTSRSLSLRIYVSGRYGTFATSDLREAELRGFVREAVAMTLALEPDPSRAIPDPSLFAAEQDELELELVDPAVHTLEMPARIEACMAIGERAREHERLVSATASVSDSSSFVVTRSTNGFSGSHERTMFARGGSVTLQDEGDARPAGSAHAAARHLADLPSPGELGDEARRQGARRLGASVGPTRRGTIVVEPRAAGRLIGLLLGPASARAFSQERSFWRGRLGERAISERLTITDEPLLRRGLASRRYDGEGIAARTLPIMERGALVNLYVDTYYGRKIAMAPTTGGSSNLVIAPGERPLDAIVRDLDDAILVTSWLGGNSDATTGDFSLGLRGHRVERGVIGAPVKEMNLTGDVLTLFGALAEVGSDPWPYSSTRVPTLVFEGAQLSGS